MKRLLLLLLLSFCWFSIYGQETGAISVQKFEIEAGAGLVVGNPVNKYSAIPSVQCYIEARNNIPGIGLDMGFQMTMASFNRNTCYEAKEKVVCRFSTMTFLDYNYRRNRYITPFAGLGVGVAEIDHYFPHAYEDGSIQDDKSFTRSAILCPRFGFKFCNYGRLTLDYRWMDKRYSYFSLNLGVVFGGKHID